MKIYNESANVEVPFQFQIPASSGVSVYLAEDLPVGLTCSSTGLISGTPSVAEQRSSTLLISNGATCSAASLSLTVVGPPQPVILGANSAQGIVDFSFSYQIVATATPAITSYGASNLPAGLSVNTSTGLISGTPTTATASTTVVVSATNSGGTTNANVNFVILAMPPPVYSGVSSVTLTKNVSGSFQITSSNPAPYQPTSFSASGLPSGMTINSSTGLISGTPTTVSPVNVAAARFFLNFIDLFDYVIGDAVGPIGTVTGYSSVRIVRSIQSGGEIAGAPSFNSVFAHSPGTQLTTNGGLPAWYNYNSITPPIWPLPVFMEGTGDARRLGRLTNPDSLSYLIGGKNSGSRPQNFSWSGVLAGSPASGQAGVFGAASLSVYQSTSLNGNTLTAPDAIWNLPTWPYYDQIFRLKNEQFLVASPSYSVTIPQIPSRSSIIRLSSTGVVDNNWAGSFLVSRSYILGEKDNGTIVVYAEPNIHFLNSQGNILSTGSVSFSYPSSIPGDFYSSGGSAGYWIAGNFNHIKGGGLQPDGKIIMGRETDIIRISADGNTIDTSFSSPTDFAGFTQNIGGNIRQFPVIITQIHVYKNGKILVCGRFNSFRGEGGLYGLIRLMPDGSRDTSFNYSAVSPAPNSSPADKGSPYASFRVLADGRIALIRPSQYFPGYSQPATFDMFVILNSDGSVDTSVPFSTNNSSNAIGYLAFITGVGGNFQPKAAWKRAMRSLISGPYAEDFIGTPTTATVTLTNAGGSTSVPINFSVVDY